MSLDASQSQVRLAAGDGGPMHQVMGRRWAIAAGHPLAAQAGARILAAGGNAVDAGVAAGVMLGVVHPDMVGFAGVAPLLVHTAATGETTQVSGVGPYPRAVTAELYRSRWGEIPAGLPRAVVPAAPDAWCTALERWGTMRFADVVAPALECAEQGFPLSVFSAFLIERSAEGYRRWPTLAALFLPDGAPPRPGDRLIQPELAGTIRLMIAAEARARRRGRAPAIRAARDVFYRGEIARRIADFVAREGGLLTLDDLAGFQVDVGPALTTTFGDTRVAACGFWCQGPVLLQMLNLLEPYDLVGLGHNSPRYLHVLTEAMKLAFADREAYYGDPDHVKVPAEALLSKAYAEVRRALIRPDRAWPDLPPAGDPEALVAVRPGGAGGGSAGGGPVGALDTSYVAVVDGEGNAFSATPSDPSVDGPLVPGVGCVISPRGSQGWLTPGHPSEVAPGKRPRLTPAPAIAFRDGGAIMPFGTPGGDVQQQAMLQVLLNVTVFGMGLQEAIEAPRVATRSFPDSFWPHPHAPGVLEVESRISEETRRALGALGHAVTPWPDWDWRAGAVCAVLAPREGLRLAGADPRRGAHAIAW